MAENVDDKNKNSRKRARAVAGGRGRGGGGGVFFRSLLADCHTRSHQEDRQDAGADAELLTELLGG